MKNLWELAVMWFFPGKTVDKSALKRSVLEKRLISLCLFKSFPRPLIPGVEKNLILPPYISLSTKKYPLYMGFLKELTGITHSFIKSYYYYD